MAILFISTAFAPNLAFSLVAVAMAVGGLLSSKRVAETMAHKVTGMTDGQSFTANLITSVIVLGASKLGLPVSTTHVSCGALFGIGTINKKGNWPVIRQIVLAWALTLPLGALLAGLSYQLIIRFFA